MSNAIKYSKKSGTVKIKTNIIGEKDKESIYRGIKLIEKNLLVKISDDGIGIPISQQDNIFLKMYRASNAQKLVSEGNGLGLYLVKSLVSNCGGQVWFESTENKGTTFYVLIPLANLAKKGSGIKLLDV